MNELARPGSLVLAVCGASGQIYARAVLKVAARNNLPVDLILSANAVAVAAEELDGHDLDPGLNARIRRHPNLNLHSPLASGSHRTAGMIICPCTLNTLGALVGGGRRHDVVPGVQVAAGPDVRVVPDEALDGRLDEHARQRAVDGPQLHECG